MGFKLFIIFWRCSDQYLSLCPPKQASIPNIFSGHGRQLILSLGCHVYLIFWHTDCHWLRCLAKEKRVAILKSYLTVRFIQLEVLYLLLSHTFPPMETAGFIKQIRCHISESAQMKLQVQLGAGKWIKYISEMLIIVQNRDEKTQAVPNERVTVLA